MIIEALMRKAAQWAERNESLALILIFAVAMAAQFVFFAYFPGGFILRYDSYLYLLKSIEIAHGNWMPLRTHSFGLSIFAAPFFHFFGSASVFVNMAYANFISLTLGALIVFPLYFLGKRLLGGWGAIAASFFISFSYWWSLSSMSFGNEPLFAIFLILTVLCLVRMEEEPNAVLLSAVFGSLAYWVRPNGIVILPIIVFSWFFSTVPKRLSDHWRLLCAIMIFSALSAPFLWQRYAYFGSPLSYGENSRYFAHDYAEVWSSRAPAASALERFADFAPKDYFDAFVLRGFGAMTFILLMITLPLSFFFLWGIIISLSSRNFLPIHLLFLFWIMSFLPLFHFMGVPRHFFPLLPLAAIYIFKGVDDAVGKHRYRHGMLSFAAATALPFLIISFVHPQYYWLPSSLNYMEFGRWMAAHVKGTIAMGRNNDLIMMNLPDTGVGGRGLFDLEAPLSRVKTVYPGPFADPEEIMPWFKSRGVTHMVMDHSYQPNFPLDTYTGNKIPPYWKLLHAAVNPIAGWNMSVYEIDWEKYKLSL